MDKYVIVGLGGFLGACARYWVSGWAAEKWGATTFSTYTYESVQLLLTGNGWSGIANLLSSNLLGLPASVLGIALGRRV